jgi:hypothetical protein
MQVIVTLQVGLTGGTSSDSIMPMLHGCSSTKQRNSWLVHQTRSNTPHWNSRSFHMRHVCISSTVLKLDNAAKLTITV